MKTIDEIYEHIGESIVTAVEHDNWTIAQLDIEIVGTGVVGYTGEYSIEAEKHDLSIRKLPREIRSWIRELHELTTAGGNNRWNRSVFTLTPDGKFNMEFIWDQALHDEVERLSE